MNTYFTRMCTTAALALLAVGAGAQTPITYNWTNAAGGVFADAANWSPEGGPPTAWDLDTVGGGDKIEFNLNQEEPYTLTIGEGDTFGIAYVLNDCVLVDLGGNILESGKIASGAVFVGSGSGNVGTLIVTNGTWHPRLHWQIGHAGGTGLLINDGAWLKNKGDINISNGGTGTYIVRNGGKHTFANSFKIGSNPSSKNGTLVITNAGSYAEVNGCYIQNNSRAYIGEGTHLQCTLSLAVFDTSLLAVEGALWLYKATYFGKMKANLDLDGGALAGSGVCTNMTGNPLANPFTTRNNGTILPGGEHTPGTLVIGPTTYTQTDGKVVFEIGGTEPGQYDRLVILGSVSLDPAGAVCEVQLLDGYEPEIGDTFDVFDFDSLEGTFGQLDLPLLDRSMQWETNLLYTAGSLGITRSKLPVTCISIK